MNSLTKTKGISLPLVIGMLTVLMISAVSINVLIIRALQSAQRIEASSRAYMAAEAGLEDALYELAPHLAGYQTSGRKSRFNTEACTLTDNSAKKWCNEWEIISFPADSDCSVEVCGKLRADQKLMVYFFKDISGANPGENKINSGQQNIASITPGNFTITFRIPDGTLGTDEILQIDNDRDWDPIVPSEGINEDPEGRPCDNSIDPNCVNSCEKNPADNDCDGQIDEDSSKDPVILWKLTDETGRSLIPMPGCLEDISSGGSEICEKDFNYCSTPNKCSVILNENANGSNQNGDPQTINQFIDDPLTGTKIQFEFLIIAPLEHISPAKGRIDIPYIEYEVDLDNNTPIPSPFFTIKSDGYYGNYKQSLSTRVLPKTTVPLFDFTIIQQK